MFACVVNGGVACACVTLCARRVHTNQGRLNFGDYFFEDEI